MKPAHILLLLAVVAIWGFNFVFVVLGLQELPPMLLCFTRFFLVSFPAIFFFKKPTVPFRWVVLYGLIMFVLQFALMFSGMRAGMSAGMGSILLQTQVFFSILFAALLLKEKLNRWQFGGALLSFLGVAMVGLNLGSGVTLSGLFLVLAASATWGLGSVLVKMMGKTQSGSLLVWGGTIAWPPLLLLSLLFEESHPILLNIHQLEPETYAAIFFITFCSTAFGFGVWNRLVQIYPVATIAPFTLLVPFFGMLSSTIFLNESLESWKIFAGILVIGGLCINLIGSRLLAQRALE